MIQKSLHKDPLIEEEKISASRPEEVPVLTPIIKPEDGTARLMYGIAFDPSNEQHPMREISQALFTNGGEIPAETAATLSLSGEVYGVIRQNPDGSLFSKPIVDVFIAEQVRHDISTTPQHVLPAENLQLKALRATSAMEH